MVLPHIYVQFSTAKCKKIASSFLPPTLPRTEQIPQFAAASRSIDSTTYRLFQGKFMETNIE